MYNFFKVLFAELKPFAGLSENKVFLFEIKSSVISHEQLEIKFNADKASELKILDNFRFICNAGSKKKITALVFR